MSETAEPSGDTPPYSLSQIRLPHRDPLALLNLQANAAGQRRTTPDRDYEEDGWAVVPSLTLQADDGTTERVGPSLLVAVHSADAQPDPDDIDIELDLPVAGQDEPIIVLTRLSSFIRVWLPRLLPRAGAPPHVVLAICNPRNTTVPRPPMLTDDQTLHFAHGDVLSWLDEFDDRPAQIRLTAHAWIHA